MGRGYFNIFVKNHSKANSKELVANLIFVFYSYPFLQKKGTPKLKNKERLHISNQTMYSKQSWTKTNYVCKQRSPLNQIPNGTFLLGLK